MRRGTGRSPVSARRTHGAALLLVLWLIALLTALVGAFAMTAQVEGLQGRVLIRGLDASNAARAGLEYALTRIDAQDPRRQWQPDGRVHAWQFHGAEVEVRIVDESGKVDLNHADANLLGALLRALGRGQLEAGRLASAVIDWRDADLLTQPAGGAEDPDYAAAGREYGAKDSEFESIAELQQVLGFTPELFALVEPHVTVHNGRQQPDPAFASAEVLDAMGMDGAALVDQRRRTDPVTGQAPPAAGFANRSGTYSIDSRATTPDGRTSGLRTVVRAGGNAVPGQAYTALRWEEGVSPP